MKYEVLIFDADQTLFDFKKSERIAFEKTILDFEMKYDENYHFKIYKKINTNIWKELEEGKITQKKLKVERFRRLGEALKENFDPTEFAKKYMKHLSEASILYGNSIEIIKELKKDYRLTIMTNGLVAVQENRIRKSVIAKYFEDIVISEEIGKPKPNPEIFQEALKNINYSNKEKVIIIGDSLTSDIQGGVNFGIDTCWFNPDKLENKKEISPTYEISSLEELKEVLL